VPKAGSRFAGRSGGYPDRVEQGSIVLGLEVPCNRTAPARVRLALAEIEEVGWVLGDAILVASELVTNAVTHSGGGPSDLIEVRVSRGTEGVMISVRDPGTSGKQAEIPGRADIDMGGLGLRIVDAIALRWGAERGDGYCVWAELPPSE
jgi:serine/threonine-protein kinase RsbW